MDDRLFRDAMGKFSTGITVVTIEEDNSVFGMTVNAFMSVSLDPKLIAVSIDESTRMYHKLQNTERFGISILSKHQKEYSKIFARQQHETNPIAYDKLDGVPILSNAITSLSCKVEKAVPAGDHLIFIAEVTDLIVKDDEPIIFFGGNYRNLE